MTNSWARVQRRPFLTPIWLSVLGALTGLCLVVSVLWISGRAATTTVIIVRHAEKQLDTGVDPPGVATPGGDPPLTAAGEARAALLARMFGDPSPGHIDAIYVSPTLRSRATAAPLAARLGLAPIVVPESDMPALASRLLREHDGGRILVVGHADTMMALVESLSRTRHLPPIGAQEYGTMYIVTVPHIGRPELLRVNY